MHKLGLFLFMISFLSSVAYAFPAPIEQSEGMSKSLTTTKTKKHHKHSTKKHKSKLKPMPLNAGLVLPYQTPDCGEVPNGPLFQCKFVCPYDPHCQVLGWNRSELACGCGAQICQNMNLYGFPSYTNGEPLNDSQIAIQPHVTASCNCTVPAEIAPYHQAIQNETCNGNLTPPAEANPPAQENPPIEGNFYPLLELLDQGSDSSAIK